MRLIRNVAGAVWRDLRATHARSGSRGADVFFILSTVLFARAWSDFYGDRFDLNPLGNVLITVIVVAAFAYLVLRIQRWRALGADRRSHDDDE